MNKIEAQALLRYAGFTGDVAKRITDNFVKENKTKECLVRLFYKNGGKADYYLYYPESAGNYIAKSMQNSIDQNKADNKFVIGGKII